MVSGPWNGLWTSVFATVIDSSIIFLPFFHSLTFVEDFDDLIINIVLLIPFL